MTGQQDEGRRPDVAAGYEAHLAALEATIAELRRRAEAAEAERDRLRAEAATSARLLGGLLDQRAPAGRRVPLRARLGRWWRGEP